MRWGRPDASNSSPFVAALAACDFCAEDIACLIDGRMSALERTQSRALEELEAEAAIVGPSFMRLSLEALGLSPALCPPGYATPVSGSSWFALPMTGKPKRDEAGVDMA